MWIAYAVIAIITYSAAYGTKIGTVGAGIGAFMILGVIVGASYFAYTMTPLGIMMETISPKIDDKHKEQRNSMYSSLSRNVLTVSLTSLLLVLSFWLSSFSKSVSIENIFDTKESIHIIVLLVGMVALCVPLYKYKTLARSEKREIEYLEDESKKHYQLEINKYLEDRRKNVTLSDIEYLGGHHSCEKKIYILY